MIEIHTPLEMLKEAKRRSDETLRNIPNIENKTGLSANNRYAIGALGELAFQKLLDDAGKYYVYEPKQDGKSDQYDFLIRYGNIEYELDVKTGGGTHLPNMFVPKSQLEAKEYPLYVGCRRNKEKNTVEIWGYTMAFDLHEVPSKIPSLGRSYRNLKPIQELLKKLT